MTESDELTQLGRYRILESLGQGAMAVVYLAELETIGGFKRKVALKVVRDEFARDPKFAQLLTREAMIGSYLQHPNIVETLEFEDIDGRMFLALEFVEGETVEDLLEQRKEAGDPGLQVDLAMEVIIQVLHGLSYAHNLHSPDDGKHLGIIHRDLKPGNLMISRHGHVKIMDFGIAKAKFQSATLTAQGQVRGTPIYMAPEQVTGKVLDGRTDQFAVATVLHEIITGQQLFIGRNLLDIMRMVCKAEVGTAVADLKEIDPRLAIAAQRMWSIRPKDRFPDCRDAAQALEECLPAIKAAVEAGKEFSPLQSLSDGLSFSPVFESASLPEMPQHRDRSSRLKRFFALFGRGPKEPPRQTRPQLQPLTDEAKIVMGTASTTAPSLDSAQDPGESSKIEILFEDATMSSLDGDLPDDED
jgi:serine/threonine-protein kinase